MEKLFTEFSPVSKREWRNKVKKDLKGRPIDGLNWPFEGAEFSPFFHADDLKPPPSAIPDQRADNSWEIGEAIIVNKDYKKANEIALQALEGGCTLLSFTFRNLPDSKGFQVLLNKIQLELIRIHFSIDEKDLEEYIALFQEFIYINELDISKISGSFEVDKPIDHYNELVKIRSRFTSFYVFCIEKSSVAQAEKINPICAELAAILFDINFILKKVGKDAGQVKKIAQSIKVKTFLTDDYFANISKLRALRLLVQNVFNAYLSDTISIPIEVVIRPENPENDPNYNIIKANAQAMTAVVGGADRIFISFSNHHGNPERTTFSRRIARNINHLLNLESHMTRVKDPASGSYFIEEMTQHICKTSWIIFQKLIE